MNLSLVASNKFRIAALNLTESFLKNVDPNGKIIYCYFGDDFPKNYIEIVKDYYKDKIIFREVEKLCDHAWNTGIYFFKTYALKAASELNEDFIYFDSAITIYGYPHTFIDRLNKFTRVFVQYPQDKFFLNSKWTTKKCLNKINDKVKDHWNIHQYEGGVQAYLYTKDNWEHINQMLELMKDIDIAGPLNHTQYPEECNGCQAHRNDQSVLTSLIALKNWEQPFDKDFFADYGDRLTVKAFTPEYLNGTNCYKNIFHYDRIVFANDATAKFIPIDLLVKIR